MTVRPFPWPQLPRVRRGATTALSGFRRSIAAPSVVSRAIDALGALVGAKIVATPENAGNDLALTLTTHNTVALYVAPTDTSELGAPWWVVLEVELSLVVALVARVARRPPPRVIHAGSATPTMIGAFAATVAAALRRAGLSTRVSALGAASPPLPYETADVAGVSLAVDGEANHVRVFFPPSLRARGGPPFDKATLAAMGPVPLDLPIVACRMLSSLSDLALLGRGDGWKLEGAWTLGSRKTPRGAVTLCAGASERGLRAIVEDDGRLVLRDGTEELSWTPMGDENNTDAAVVEAVGDVPVVVRVEIGSARMTAHDWSVLQPGDVVGLGTKLGSSVVLRVSGIVVAEGELVDLEGEVAVRIHRRFASASK